MDALITSILALVVLFAFFLNRQKAVQPKRTELLRDGSWHLKTPQYEIIEVVGESYKNSDGIDRQTIIKKLELGDNINLIAEPNNKYSESGKAVAVWSKYGQIGYLSEHDNRTEDIFDALLDKKNVAAEVLNILGGVKDKPNLGVWLDVNI